MPYTISKASLLHHRRSNSTPAAMKSNKRFCRRPEGNPSSPICISDSSSSQSSSPPPHHPSPPSMDVEPLAVQYPPNHHTPTAPPSPPPSTSAAPPSTRSRPRQTKIFPPPPDADLRGHLNFDCPIRNLRLHEISTLPVVPGKYIHSDTLDTLGIRDRVDTLLAGAGWPAYYEVTFPAFLELVREFYSTFQFNRQSDLDVSEPEAVSFRLMGIEFSHSLDYFAVALGLGSDPCNRTDNEFPGHCDFPTDFDPSAVYQELTANRDGDFNSRKTKDLHLQDPALLYLHRFLAYSFSG